MAIINNAKGLIITNGLGGPACCALLTAGFGTGLVCGCKFQVEIVTGGGPYIAAPYFSPIGQKLDQETRLVLIRVVYDNEIRWRKQYIIDKPKADILVEIIGFINAIKDKTSILVQNLKQTTAKVIATFVDKYPDKKD